MGFTVTYGEGGHDPSKPNNNIVAVIEIPDEQTEPDVTNDGA